MIVLKHTNLCMTRYRPFVVLEAVELVFPCPQLLALLLQALKSLLL